MTQGSKESRAYFLCHRNKSLQIIILEVYNQHHMEENGEGSSPTLGQKVTNFVDGLRGWNALDSPGMEREARRNFLQLSRLEKSYDRQLIANLGEWPRTKRPRTSRSQERQMFITRPTETEENGKKVRSWYCYTDTGAVLKYYFV